jgi:MFS family permease
MGIAMGSIMPASFQIATLGVSPRQAGAASAMVSTSQQVGGAIGTAVLNTLAATAATAYVTDHAPTTPQVLADGAIHSFSVAYSWSAGIFLLGAVLTATLFRTRADRAARLADAAPAAAHGEPVLAH